ncbi:MAG: FAD-binding oxidoreductase [Alphaproteobacteria bacterium]
MDGRANNARAASEALDRIKSAVGPNGWISDERDMAPYLVEPRGRYRGHAALVVRPANREEVAEVVRLAAEAGIAVVPQSGNTGLVGGSIPFERGDEVVLSLGRMNRVRALDPENYTITVEAGCVLADVQAAAARADRLFPLSLGAEGSCMIGGNLSTNAGGTAVLRYGNARDLVLGLEVVLPDGTVWDGLRSLRKDNTGYDLKHIFLGAEGTLGVITAAVLKLFPRPREVETAFAGVADVHKAVALFTRAREANGDAVSACEIVPRIGLEFVLSHLDGARDPLAAPHAYYVLLELSGFGATGGLRDTLETLLGEAAEAGILDDATIAANAEQAESFWRLREGLSEVQRHEGGSIKHDIAVPLSRVADFIVAADAAVMAALPGVRPVTFGHLGDGNIHYNLSQPVGADTEAYLARWDEFNRIVNDIAVGMGGSFSAEHGIGRMRRGELERYKSPVEIALMRRLKAAFDPKNIMNPGKVV